MASIVLLYIAVALGAMRVAGLKTLFFQAIAHVFVGGLFGAFFASRERFYLWVAVSLTVTEAVVFAASRLMRDT